MLHDAAFLTRASIAISYRHLPYPEIQNKKEAIKWILGNCQSILCDFLEYTKKMCIYPRFDRAPITRQRNEFLQGQLKESVHLWD